MLVTFSLLTGFSTGATVDRTFQVAQTNGRAYLFRNSAAIYPAQQERYGVGFWFNLQSLTPPSGSTYSVITSIGQRINGNIHSFRVQVDAQGVLGVAADETNKFNLVNTYLGSVAANSWHYLYLDVNQRFEASPNIVFYLDGTAKETIDYGSPDVSLDPFPADPFIILGGEIAFNSSSTRILPKGNALFHTFSLWRLTDASATAVANFNSSKVVPLGSAAFDDIGTNNGLPANQTILNALIHYTQLNGSLVANPPGQSFTGNMWEVWNDGNGGLNPVYQTVTQSFQAGEVSLSITAQPSQAATAVGALVTPSLSTSTAVQGARVSFKAPEFVYLDRTGRVIRPPAGADVPLPEDREQAVSRWRTLGYTVAGTSISGTDRAVDIVADQAINFQWQFQREVALIVDSALPNGLSSPGSGNPSPAPQKVWVKEGTGQVAKIDGAVFAPDVLSNDVRYRIRGYELQNHPDAATQASGRYLRCLGDAAGQAAPDLAGAPGATVSFWLRQHPSATASASIVTLGGTNGLGLVTDANKALRLKAGVGTVESEGSEKRSDVWNHWTLVHETAATGTNRLYLNGRLVGSRSGAVTLESSLALGNAVGFDLDDLRVWRRPLSAREVTETMFSTPASAGASASLLMDLDFDAPPQPNFPIEALATTWTFQASTATPLTISKLSAFSPKPFSTPAEDRFFVPVTYGDPQQVPEFVLNSYAVVRWHWLKEYKVENLTVNGNFDTALSMTTGKSGSLASAGTLWVADGDSLTVSAKKVTTGGDSANGFVGLPTGTFENVIFSPSGLDVSTSPTGLTSSTTATAFTLASAAVGKPGRLIWNYGSTIYAVEVTLGTGVDPLAGFAFSPSATLASLNLASTPQAPFTVTQLIADNPSDASVANVARWDSVQRRLFPVRPGQFLLSWPTADGQSTKLVRVIAGFPLDTYRFDNGSTRSFAGISDGSFGAPLAHFEAVYNDDVGATGAGLNPPIHLDPDPVDRWFFNTESGLAYSEKLTRKSTTGQPEGRNVANTGIGQTKDLLISERCRSVLVFSARPTSTEAATGDLQREQLVVRIVESHPLGERQQERASLGSGEGTVARFDGTTALDVANAPGLGDASICVEFWAQWQPTDATARQVLLRLGSQSGPGTLLTAGFGAAADGHAFFLDFGGQIYRAPATLTDAHWHHWSFSYSHDGNPVDRTLSIHRDGVRVLSATNIAVNFSGSSAMRLGGDGVGGANAFEGKIDNFRVWSFPLGDQSLGRAMLTAAPVIAGFSGNLTSLVSFDFDVPQASPTLPQSGSSAATGQLVGPAASSPLTQFYTVDADSVPEVATRLSSRLDLAGFGSGFITREVANFNASVYHRDAAPGAWGPIFPVNASNASIQRPGTASPDVTWYRNDSHTDSLTTPNVAWPWRSTTYGSVRFPVAGPWNDRRLYIASRIGSEGVDSAGVAQPVFDANRYTDLAVYTQPDPEAAGYNPNEEHALTAPSVRHLIGGAPPTNSPPTAVFALRNDLNLQETAPGGHFTSEPWVLAQFTDTTTGEPGMMAWKVEQTRNASVNSGVNIERRTALYPQLGYEKTNFASFLKPLTAQPANPTYDFQYPIFAGDPLAFPYPLGSVIGATVPPETAVTPLDDRRVFWKDHKGNPWVVSGREPSPTGAPAYEARFDGRFWYPLQPGFWFDLDDDGESDVPIGTSVAWLPENGVMYSGQNGVSVAPRARAVRYEAFWKSDYPVLKTGETLTFAGGEYKADHPSANGLPGIVGWAAAQVIFDTATPTMATINQNTSAVHDPTTTATSARVIRPLDARTVALDPATDLPAGLNPANRNALVRGTQWFFTELSASLQNRVVYDTIAKTLTVRGLLNSRAIGDPALTAPPASLSVLEPNVLSRQDLLALQALDDLAGTPDPDWDKKVADLYNLSRNPEQLDLLTAVGTEVADDATSIAALYYPGLMPFIERDAAGNFIYDTEASTGLRHLRRTATRAEPLMSLGAGSALVLSPRLLDFTAADFSRPIYVTLAENNHPDLGAAPVSLHVIRISPERYRGGVKVILPPNAFDEKVTLRHTADFGGALEDVAFEWYASEVDGDIPATTPDTDAPLWRAPLSLDGAPVTTAAVDLVGLPERLLSDQWVFARYRKATEAPFAASAVPLQGASEEAWRKPTNAAAAPYQWAGAANSPQIQANGSLRYVPALATGWVKRVLDRINPYEARIDDFYNNASPATYTSMIQQAGARPTGPVALNSDKDVVENVGLIALYQTVLDRAFALASATHADTNGVQQALLLAGTRISDFYMLLGNEAYSDALDPTIGLGTGSVSYGKFAPSVWSFQNQEPSLLSEELALLRGTDFAKAWPVDNRLFWNFVKGEGEAAYASNYQVSDANHDGFINEADAALLFPQGHGDAWGSYTTALRTHYRLLQSGFFRWLSRSEFYNLADNVLKVDYLDEAKFAATAAARARAGSAIVRQTYRAAYTANPDGQWQGYTDVDSARAWGVKEWGKRAGQGAYFDWLSANSLLAAEAPDLTSGGTPEGLQKIDRSNVPAVGEVAASLVEIQAVLDDAALGLTPVGVGEDAVPFDIDPTFLQVGSTIQGHTHFEQIQRRAVTALRNAVAAFNHANEADERLRQVASTTQQLSEQAVDQDRAFRARMKALFGTPYAGTIGAGKLYPAGYDGPDLFLWLYVDRTGARQYLPPESGEYQTMLTAEASYVSEVPESFQTLYSVPAASKSLAQFFKTYLEHTFADYDPASGSFGATMALGTDLENVFRDFQLPTYTEATYGFLAPSDWGQRAVTGELQSEVNELVGAQIAVLKAVDDYQAYLRELRTDLDQMFAKQEIMLEQTDAADALLKAKKAVEAAFLAADIAKAGVDTAGTTVKGIQRSIRSSLPLIVGLSNDVSAPIRGGIESTLVASAVSFDGAAKGIELAKTAAGFAFSIVEGNFEIYDDALNRRQDLMSSAKALQEKANGESTLRFALAAAINRLVQREQTFSRTVAEATALLDEREAANRRLAANVQRERYNDMTLRVVRNDALQKYRDAFELAARYTYLAARAFDYETNLADSHPANPTALLTKIVSARLPGALEDGEPLVNGGGLAEILAKLSANYENLRGQLGINQPEFEAARLSLRRELFRVRKTGVDSAAALVDSDTRWRQALNERVVPNLWNVPEFRAHCIAPWTVEQGAQAGLVIPFESQIVEGRNFFGWPLGGGDQSYDATRYSTKIIGTGVWLEGYDGQNLAVAPRVWLVPAGEDVMLVPRAAAQTQRRWSVVDQAIPVPYTVTESNLQDQLFLPGVSSLSETFGAQRRFSRFRAYHDDGGSSFSESEVAFDTRLVGRSVWNTKWLLILPGSTLSADGTSGLQRLIGSAQAPGIRDIKLVFKTYSASGN